MSTNPVALAAVAAVMGLVYGSFLNVAIHRLPNRRSLLGRSACPKCSTPIAAHHNVPVLGWLWLRGRSSCCATPISARYPLVEAATSVLFAIAALVHHDDPALLAIAIAAILVMVPAALVDWELAILPHTLWIAGALTLAGALTVLDPDLAARAWPYALVTLGVLGAVALLLPMGIADAYLLSLAALMVQWRIGYVLITAALISLLLLAVIARRHRNVHGLRNTGVPMVPGIAASTVLWTLLATTTTVST
ncbi:prepilin peptidase [Conexibacter sp. W3-3-2]|uniref:prepilin peptidase n=1 Tax=Conexibacter sp. W3-3-2 TaxID=2675227 RepID=UPI0012B84300|nr:A24 family peptidase [Conexibacter sp. W3-3-2]MTD47139.1 prepilin peptidase [Conexibacter sp. W3-3-2]MTD47406.1 prepilin peptidase [Conexibacter sp. W3-3-2]